ncbi:MAG: hypothetical protein WCS98_08480 [Bacillota bacterium]|nr:hypothetical protein [Bacillota bacterium]MDD3851684.1 hypothetical protein [Bacillota bacterium]
MVRNIGILVMVMVLFASVLAFAAPVKPMYIPVSCDLWPEHQFVSSGDNQKVFEGNWFGGATSTYFISMDYGDGNKEEYYEKHNLSWIYAHFYNTAGKPDGYKWYPRLTVTNGNTDRDDVIVEVMVW